MGARIVFITGTDTGVGKTLLTALLLHHLRARGAQALALKPFCSGSRADAQLLHNLQDGDLTLEEVNPFYFPEPVAPLVSARRHRRRIPLDKVLKHIHSIAARVGQFPGPALRSSRTKNVKLKTTNFLLVEGSGGLLVPLGKGYTVRDLIARLACEVIVVSRNRLGTINHTLLTVQSLQNAASCELEPSAFSLQPSPRVVLMDCAVPDSSSVSNAAVLAELLAPTPFFRVRFLGRRCSSLKEIKRNSAVVGSTLAEMLR